MGRKFANFSVKKHIIKWYISYLSPIILKNMQHYIPIQFQGEYPPPPPPAENKTQSTN